MRKYEYIAIGGESSFSSDELIGKDILSVIRDGDGCSKIVSVSPTNNQAQYVISTGTIAFASQLDSGTEVLVLFQDKGNVCFPPSIPGSYIMPGINAGFNYASSFYISGSKNFTISSVTKPSWVTYTLSGDLVTFTGTPAISDAGSNEVKFTVSNSCGSVAFDKTFTVGVLDANFGVRTYISGDRTDEVEQITLTGTPGVVATVTLTSLFNNNGGELKVNGIHATEGNTYNIILEGIIKCEISGFDSFGTVIKGLFTITSVSAGGIGLSQTYQTSKVF